MLLMGCGALLAVLAAVAGWMIFFSGPSIHVVDADGRLSVDTKFLGEYCIGLSEVSVLDRSTGQPVWSLRPVTPPYMNLCDFALRPGDNPAVPPRTTDALVVAPRDAATFSLLLGTPYTLRVCGNNGFARDRCSHASLELH
jgi:hypothetical protein